MILILPTALILLVLFFYEKHGLRESIVYGATLFGVILLVITELLSAMSLLTFVGAALSWTVVILALSVRVARSAPGSIPLDRLSRDVALGWHRWFSLPILLALAVTLFISLVAPPNNYDSMTYHMSRVIYWIQNRTVAHFPTHNTRQIFMSPWAEYAILHLQLLGFGSDRFANLVQWCAFPGTMVAASLVVAQMGGSRGAQWFAALLVASTPMAILQATSTQTDLLCSFWILSFVWILLRLADEEKPRPLLWVFAGFSLGLAVSTKGTAYIFCAPFIAGLVYVAVAGRRVGAYIRGGCIMFVLMIALNAPHYVRNARTFGTPLGDPAQMKMLSNETHSPAIVVSNLVRNISLHLQTPFAVFNDSVEQAVIKLHRASGLDPSDPGSTWGKRYRLATAIFHEDYGGNFLLFCLLTIAGGVLFFRKKPRKLGWYLPCAVAGFLLYSYQLKWQLWGSRLQLPFFMIMTPVCSLAVTCLSAEARRITSPLAILFALSALPWLFNNTSRPLLPTKQNRLNNILRTPRLSQYFNNQRGLEVPLYYAMAKVNSLGCDSLGLYIDMNSFEYPLVPIQKDINPERNVYLRHIFVANPSSRLPLRSPDVCAIMTIDKDRSWQPGEPFTHWKPVYVRDRIRVFAP